ncbi:undecaprenyl-phosphate glucose phosphotransferase [Oceanisphaera arctica]|uniref:Undecaprenyl-phosphate glucose phosphotransferase n=1 Tax=Oceanisphaera arctica TaxID=641510 RepID=A0A2P5TLJ0_9GAMM|nr:undecaprenyl-phosphate glucose phosphotransferase [Oceanisphaera arctica]PPL16166.1 undecaprenyl-phosphate glucose phosphotransferase [Oceanisphaera arctica]GHA06383.1 undecaprenyl-phosphate glucose phosphotransferase [Oceanisphaera arctica]
MLHSSSGLTERFPPHLVVPPLDAAALVAGALLAHGWRFGHFNLPDRYWLATVIMVLLVTFINSTVGAYERWRITRISSLLARLFLVWLGVAALVASVVYLTHSADRYSRLWVSMALLISFVLSGAVRVAIQLLLRQARRQGRSLRSVFMVGPGQNIRRVGRGMRSTPEEGYCIAGIQRLGILGVDAAALISLSRRVAQSGAQEVWICVPLEMGPAVRSIFYALRHHTVEVRFIPEFGDMQLLNHRVSEVAGQYAFDLSVTPMNGVAQMLKRLEDLVIGSLLSVLIVPLCLVIAVVIKLTSSGPVLFKQYRTGVNGKSFKVYKFRSMKVHQENNGQITQAGRQDPRFTPIGAFLRRTSLDELPQFYNVLQGRMSIVGPRPHALAHNEYYMDLVESYMKRHKVKPGITGWAQVNGLRGETDTLEKMESRVEHDLWYINNWSLWLDLRIIFWTIFKGFVNRNAY